MARYDQDYRLFVAPDGKSGFALGAAGGHTGELAGFFVSPGGEAGTAAQLTALAVQEGALLLATYDPLSRFFACFGFVEAARVLFTALEEPPPSWTHKELEDFKETHADGHPHVVYMFNAGANRRPMQLPPGRKKVVNARASSCAGCGQGVQGRTYFGIFGGYECRRCGFIDAWGALTAK